MTDHAARAAEFVANEPRLHWHDTAVWFMRNKRDLARGAIPDWEELRTLASQIKAHTLSQLAGYLEQFFCASSLRRASSRSAGAASSSRATSRARWRPFRNLRRRGRSPRSSPGSATSI